MVFPFPLDFIHFDANNAHFLPVRVVFSPQLELLKDKLLLTKRYPLG